MSSSDASGEIFARFGQPLTPDEQAAVRTIASALDEDTEAIALVASYAVEFRKDLATLAGELAEPDKETVETTTRPPRGRALVAATAIHDGVFLQDRGDLAEAGRPFRWASERFHELDERAAESLALTLYGRVEEMLDHLPVAKQSYRQALEIDRALGDQINESVDLGLLAQVAWLSGRLDEAESLSQEALALHRRERDWRNAVTTLDTLGHIAQERGQAWRARAYFARSWLVGRNVIPF
ncbi:MAG TPA: tetratricopeptide repeat protein [Ktedonobacterales bacterium]|jgi:tetratricopeptide (TPR) repeat protein